MQQTLNMQAVAQKVRRFAVSRARLPDSRRLCVRPSAVAAPPGTPPSWAKPWRGPRRSRALPWLPAPRHGSPGRGATYASPENSVSCASPLPQRVAARATVVTSAKVGDSLEEFLVQARPVA